MALWPAFTLDMFTNLLCTGVFDGRHSFRIVRRSATSVAFEQSETFCGMLTCLFPFLFKLDGARQGFEAMNAALKARAEKT